MQKNVPIVIERPNTQIANFTIVGDSPLIVHRFSEKAKKMILDKQMKKAAKKKPDRKPKEEFEAAKYKMTDGKDGFPALAIKRSIIGAARFVDDLPMTVIRGVVFMLPDDIETGLIKIKFKKCKMIEDIVRLSGMGSPADLRFRPYYYDWSMTFQIKYDADVISLEQVANLLARAGLSQGLGEWRPERSGQHGMFSIK